MAAPHILTQTENLHNYFAGDERFEREKRLVFSKPRNIGELIDQLYQITNARWETASNKLIPIYEIGRRQKRAAGGDETKHYSETAKIVAAGSKAKEKDEKLLRVVTAYAHDSLERLMRQEGVGYRDAEKYLEDIGFSGNEIKTILLNTEPKNSVYEKINENLGRLFSLFENSLPENGETKEFAGENIEEKVPEKISLINEALFPDLLEAGHYLGVSRNYRSFLTKKPQIVNGLKSRLRYTLEEFSEKNRKRADPKSLKALRTLFASVLEGDTLAIEIDYADRISNLAEPKPATKRSYRKSNIRLIEKTAFDFSPFLDLPIIYNYLMLVAAERAEANADREFSRRIRQEILPIYKALVQQHIPPELRELRYQENSSQNYSRPHPRVLARFSPF